MYLGIHIRTVDKSNQVFTLHCLVVSVCLQALNPCPMAPRKALSSLQGCITEAGLAAPQLQSCCQGSSTSWSSTPPAQPFLALLKTNFPAPFWFCTFSSPCTACNNPSEQQVVISMFAFPVLAVHWRLMKISQSIKCDLKRSTLIREALKSSNSHTTLSLQRVRPDGCYLFSHQDEEEIHLIFLKYSFA